MPCQAGIFLMLTLDMSTRAEKWGANPGPGPTPATAAAPAPTWEGRAPEGRAGASLLELPDELLEVTSPSSGRAPRSPARVCVDRARVPAPRPSATRSRPPPPGARRRPPPRHPRPRGCRCLPFSCAPGRRGEEEECGVGGWGGAAYMLWLLLQSGWGLSPRCTVWSGPEPPAVLFDQGPGCQPDSLVRA